MRTLASIAALLTALLLPAAANAAAGSLDRSLASNGRLTVKASPDPSDSRWPVSALTQIPMASASGADNDILAANDRRLLRYRPDGRPRRSFGGNGRVAIPAPAGTTFELAGLAVDSHDRVVVAGTAAPPQSEPPVSSIVVYRFRPDGSLDSSFAEGGLATIAVSPYGEGAVGATGLAVDSADRPVLTGFWAGVPTICGYIYTGPVLLNRSFVLRLESAGDPDPAFGTGGFYTEPDLEDPSLPAIAPSGTVVFANRVEGRCARVAESVPPALTVLSPDGGFVGRFAASPEGDFEFVEATSLAVDRHNRIVVLISRTNGEGGGRFQQVRRFRPDGNPDPSFGTGGATKPYVTPGGWLQAIAIDGRNRVILAGSTPRGQEASAFLAMRLSAAGKWQRWFGDEGWVVTGFGGRAQAGASQVHRDSTGRIVLGGTVEAPYLSTGFGFAFARYLSGGR